MIPVPNLSVSFLDRNGNLNSAWQSFFQQFTQAPPSATTVIVGASPFAYIAREPGKIAVVGGTVSAIAYIRGLVSINVTGQKLIPISVKDTLEVTYSVLPSFLFLPDYGNVNPR